MKKSLSIIAAVCLVLVACNKENEIHYTEVLYPSTRSAAIWADQTSDSLVILSTDSWKLTCTSPDWCIIPEGAESFKNPYTNAYVYSSLPLNFKPNTTGKLREAVITITGDDSRNAVYIAQTPYLNIIRPTRFVYQDLTESLTVLTTEATALTDSVKFKVFSEWTLQARDGSWLTTDVAAGLPGSCLVELRLTENTSTEDRTDTLILTSNGVVDSIPVLQKGAKLPDVE